MVDHPTDPPYEGACIVAGDVMIGAGAVDTAAFKELLRAMTLDGHRIWVVIRRTLRPDRVNAGLATFGIISAFFSVKEAEVFAQKCNQAYLDILHTEDLRMNETNGVYVSHSVRSSGSDGLWHRLDRIEQTGWVHPNDPEVRASHLRVALQWSALPVWLGEPPSSAKEKK